MAIKKAPVKKTITVKKKAPVKTMATKSTATPKTYNLLDNGPKAIHTPHIKHEIRQYFAEFIGTCILTFAVTLNLGYGELVLATPVIAALTVAMMVYILGGISGANLNPAVTLGLFIAKKLNYKTAIFYILAQVTGAMFAVTTLIHFNLSTPELYSVNSPTHFLLEAIGAGLLVFGVSAVASKKVPEAASGLVVGGSLLLGISLAANYTLGILNPAIALSWNLVNMTYILGPIVGGLVGAVVFKLLSNK